MTFSLRVHGIAESFLSRRRQAETPSNPSPQEGIQEGDSEVMNQSSM